MQWGDLMGSTKNVLERCWGLHHDNPTEFFVEIGVRLYGKEVTKDTYREIIEYQKHFPYFDVKLKDNVIYVKGNCKFGSWMNLK